MIPDRTLFGIETEAVDTNRAVALTINLQTGAASSDSIFISSGNVLMFYRKVSWQLQYATWRARSS